MEIKIFSVRDRALDAFNQPFYSPTTGAALRAFTDGINEKGREENKHPDDYELYELGTWDNETGKFTNKEPQPRQLALGRDLVRE